MSSVIDLGVHGEVGLDHQVDFLGQQAARKEVCPLKGVQLLVVDHILQQVTIMLSRSQYRLPEGSDLTTLPEHLRRGLLHESLTE